MAKNCFRAVPEPLQLARDAPDGEARDCGRYGAGVVVCLARKVVEPAWGSPRSNTQQTGEWIPA
jgi:hypothetical protein